MRAVSMHVHHAIVGVPCVNVVIGAVLGELHVVRVVPVFVCDAAVDLTLRSLSCKIVAIVFIVAILRRILLYWRYSVYMFRSFNHFTAEGTITLATLLAFPSAPRS